MKAYNHWFYDKWIVCTVISLLMLGLLMVSSASMVISDKQFGYPFHYLIHQLLYIMIGLSAAWVVTRIPLKFLNRISGYLLLISILLLILVLIPGVGKMVNGSKRWINLGFMSLQVTELVKLFSIVYLASYLVRYQEQVKQQLIGVVKPLALLGVMAILLLLEPDFGTFVVITATFLTLLFIAEVRLWPFILLFIVIGAAIFLIALMSPYRLARLTTFLDPWSKQFGAGYQLTQSLIAFGRGGVFGVGLGNSVQKLFYLPEAHTDFIFAVIGEELGLVGELLVIALFVILIVKIFMIATRAKTCEENFSAFLAFGIGLWLGFQALINLGVSVGVLPTKGLTLPFVSYGGSSLIVNCVAMALVLRIAFEASLSKIPIRKKHAVVFPLRSRKV